LNLTPLQAMNLNQKGLCSDQSAQPLAILPVTFSATHYFALFAASIALTSDQVK
jgi:hypothetical protein